MKNRMKKKVGKSSVMLTRVKKAVFVFIMVFLQGLQLVSGEVADGILEGSLTPGWRSVHVENPVNLSDFHSGLVGGDSEEGYMSLAQTSGLSDSTNGISVEVHELARSLFHDPDLIYGFVHNHIEYTPYWGVMKGAKRTLLDKAGNDGDQAVFLVELLRVSGYQAGYVTGNATYPLTDASGYDLVSWLDCDGKGSSAVYDTLVSSIIPFDVGATDYTLARFWVRAEIDGVLIDFDPAFKHYENYGKEDLLSMAGYSRQSLLDAAGGSATADYAEGLSNTDISAYLATANQTLRSAIKEQYPNVDIAELTGGRTLVPDQVNPAAMPQYNYLELDAWDEIPTNYSHVVRFQFDDISYSCTTADMAEHRIAVRYDATGSDQPELVGAAEGYISLGISEGVLNAPEVLTTYTDTYIIPYEFNTPVAPSDGHGSTDVNNYFGKVDRYGGVVRGFLEFRSLSAPDWTVNRVATHSNLNIEGINFNIFYNNSADAFMAVSPLISILVNIFPTVLLPTAMYNDPLLHNDGYDTTIEFSFKASGSAPANQQALFHVETHTADYVDINDETYLGYHDYRLTGDVAKKFDISGSSGAQIRAYPGNTASGYCILRNNGDENFTVTGLSIVGGDAGKFTPVNFSTGYIGPDQVAGFQIDYTADSATTRHAELKIDFTYDDIQYSLNFPIEGATIPETKTQIWLDDELVLEDSTSRSASADTLLLSIEHPYGEALPDWSPSTYHLTRAGLYVAFSGYGDSMNGAVLGDSHRKLASYQESGSFPSWMAQAETLQLIGHQWMQETMLANDFIHRLAGLNQCMHHRVGIAGQERGYYLDIKDQMATISPQDAVSARSAWKAGAMIQSAMEHGVLEQTQGSDHPAVSTIKILNESAMAGQKLFYVSSNNFSTVSNDFINYSPADLAAIVGQLDDGMKYLLPQDAQYQLYDWSGYGFIALGDEWMGLMIGGDYPHFGGYGGLMGDASSYLLEDYIAIYNKPPADVVHYYSDEPVDMATGAYVFDQIDLAVGGPLGLAFSRHYNSLQRNSTRSMGHGWLHGYDIHAETVSAYEPALGRRSLEDAGAIMLPAMILDDLIRNEDNPKGWQTSSFVAQWVVDQLVERAVAVHLGMKTLTFVRQPDGSYTSPPGTTWTLSGELGNFVMQERNGKTYAFNANNQIQTITDPDGNTLAFGYSGTMLQTVVSSFGGKSLTLQYNGNDLVERVTDHTGRYVEYLYDANENLEFYHDVEQKVWTATYDALHQIKTLVDPENTQTIENTYNELGEVVAQKSATETMWNFYFGAFRNIEEGPYGNQKAYHINKKGRTWSIEDALGNRTYSFFDGQGHVVGTVNASGVTNAFTYDIDHNLLATTNAVGTPEQVVNAFEYDSGHHLRFMTNAVGTSEQTITETTYTPTHHVDVITEAKGSTVERTTDLDYFGNGLLQQRSEGSGQRITSYTYDGNGNPDTITSTDAGTIDFGYDIQGNMETVEVDGKTTTFSYDDRRLPTGVLFEDGSSTARTYWDNGLLKTSTDARSKTTHHYWTPAYKQAGIVLPNTGSTTNLYDEADRLVRFRDAEGNWATNTLDSIGRIVEATSSSLSVTNQFDAVGNLTHSIIDPTGLNLWTSNTYDSLNRIESVESAESVGHFHYDSLSRVTNRVDSASKDWETEFDELGRVKKTFRPSGNYEEYGYDKLGNRTAFWNAEFKPMTFGVDAQGRVTSITNAINKVTSFVFDDAGNLSQRTAADLKVTDYGYDSLNRLVAITNQGVEVATFDHDANGNIVEATPSSLSATTFGYDEMNRLVASTQTVDSVTSIVGYQFDLNGNRTHVAYPGNTNAVYVFGADNRLKSVDLSAFGIATAISFNYDSASRLTNIVYPNGINSTFGLDAEGRVTSIQHGNFVDRTIQRNELGFKHTELIDAGIKPTAPDTRRSIKTHNDADQLASEWVQQRTNEYTVSYDYSANGCLTNIHTEAQSTQSFAYDYDNRIIGTTEGTEHTEYLYDASGARVGRVYNSVTNYFVIDYTDGLKRPLAETDASGTVTRFYVWSGSQLLCHIEANGTTRYYHSDELGSTLALTDESGNVTDEFAYMPYGYANHSGSTDTPFQWLGGYGVYYDSDTDLHLTLHRAYSSKLKRFIHPDPLGIDGGVNVYMWANLNPLAFVDPSGLIVLLEAHSVGLGQNHSKITIIPKNQDAYVNNKYFKRNVLPDGRVYTTLGAGAENGILPFFADLVSNPGRKTDVNRDQNVFSTTVSLPEGLTEDQFIQHLFAVDASYQDNTTYELIPNRRSNDYNSNSYASGLLNATGGTVSQHPENVPGYEKPLPLQSYGPRIQK